MKRLEREGYIEAYRAVLQRERVGLGFSVFVGVKIDGHANERALGFEKAVVAMPEVVACHLVSGESDYFLEIVVPDLDHYRRFLVDKLLDLPIVREVRSNIAIQTLKAGAPLPLGHLDARRQLAVRRLAGLDPGLVERLGLVVRRIGAGDRMPWPTRMATNFSSRSCSKESRATSSARWRGTTMAPSSSATMTSPG